MAKKEKTSDSRAAILTAYQEVFRSPLGRKVLLDLMKHHCMNTTFDENPYKSAFMEGQRAVVLNIFATLKINIKEFLANVEEINTPDNDLWG